MVFVTNKNEKNFCPESKMTIQCSGRTQKGARCLRKIIARGEAKRTGIVFCPAHKNKRPDAPLAPAVAPVVPPRVRLPGEVFDCQCCCDECEIVDKCKCTNNHEFCKSCLRRWIEEKTVGGGGTKLVCMSSADECKGIFPPKVIESVLSKQALNTWNCRVVQEELNSAALADLYTCPKCKFFAAVVEKEEYRNLGNLFECGNAECKFKSCLLCQQPYHHYNITCEAALIERKKDPGVRKVVEEILSNARIRHCPCGVEFVRVDGCNKLHCSVCFRFSCYICQQPILDYTHFTNVPPGWPLPASDIGKCPLYTSEKDVEAQCVKVAVKTVLAKYEHAELKDLLEAKNLLIKLNPEQTLNISYTFQAAIERATQQAKKLSGRSPPPVPEHLKKESFLASLFSKFPSHF